MNTEQMMFSFLAGNEFTEDARDTRQNANRNAERVFWLRVELTGKQSELETRIVKKELTTRTAFHLCVKHVLCLTNQTLLNILKRSAAEPLTAPSALIDRFEETIRARIERATV